MKTYTREHCNTSLFIILYSNTIIPLIITMTIETESNFSNELATPINNKQIVIQKQQTHYLIHGMLIYLFNDRFTNEDKKSKSKKSYNHPVEEPLFLINLKLRLLGGVLVLCITSSLYHTINN